MIHAWVSVTHIYMSRHPVWEMNTRVTMKKVGHIDPLGEIRFFTMALNKSPKHCRPSYVLYNSHSNFPRLAYATFFKWVTLTDNGGSSQRQKRVRVTNQWPTFGFQCTRTYALLPNPHVPMRSLVVQIKDSLIGTINDEVHLHHSHNLRWPFLQVRYEIWIHRREKSQKSEKKSTNELKEYSWPSTPSTKQRIDSSARYVLNFPNSMWESGSYINELTI
jgi:hypothetical protein